MRMTGWLMWGAGMAVSIGAVACNALLELDGYDMTYLGVGGQGGGGGSDCMVNEDCPDDDEECTIPFCANGKCEVYKLKDAPSPVQTPSDCTERYCDIEGAAWDHGDPIDGIDDDNDCTMDLCLGASPLSLPLPAGAPCTLNGGAMGTCNSSGICLPPPCDEKGVCGDATDPTTCLGCALAGDCADELATCQGDQACIDFVTCIDPCADQACFDACVTMYMNGATLYTDLIFCAICEQCPISCGTSYNFYVCP